MARTAAVLSKLDRAPGETVELRQREYFVAVAEELHFGRAAARLHIGQPAVSQQIRRLERELGVALFDRNPRTVVLTGAGRHFLPRARAVLGAVEQAQAAVERYVAERHTVLRLGTSTGLGDHLDRLLDMLAVAEPRLTVELVSASTAERLDAVAKGKLDAAFIHNPDGSPSELRMIPVWHDPLVAVLPAGHPIAENDDRG
jgi:DNA-binding transcriptional LysR family regulator